MTEARRDTTGRDIRALAALLVRRGWIVVVCIAAAAGAAYIYADRQHPTYEASANLLLRDPAIGPANTVFGTVTPNTGPDREALVLSEAIKTRSERALAPSLGGAAAARLAIDDVAAVSASESDVVKITSTAPTGKSAALVANTIAEQNIAYRRSRNLAKIRRAQAAARKALRELGPAGTNPQQLNAINQTRAGLQALNQAQSVQDGDAEILQRASIPTAPASPKPQRSAVIGAFAGLLLGFALALVREQLDRRLREAKDLGDTFGLPILASVPTSRSFSNMGVGNGIDSLPPAEREAFQMLRANLRFLNTERELRSCVVTSAASGDGKTTVALNLAMADASVGRNVLLIESDMRRPSIARVLGLEGTRGLASYLVTPDAKLADVVHRVRVTPGANGSAPLEMDVIVSGAIPTNPSELINSDRMLKLIAEAERNYDLVVIDTSPVGIVADAIPLMSAASAVIVVSRVGRITSAEANALRDQLQRIDAPAFGLVANFAGARARSYGYY